ncbi:MAG: FG-GAP repeat domain-containing protein, partial [Puniceicoccales bacterium]
MHRLLLFLTTPLAALAANSTVQIDGPEVLKLDWGVRALAQGDIDQDGREDIAVINNDRARIEILYQREPGEARKANRSLRTNRWSPVLEDARFERDSAASGIAMFDLELGDVTGDGRPDVIFTSKDEPLVVVPQMEDGLWGEKREYDGLTALPWQSTMQLVELSDEYDGLELAMLAKDKLLVFGFDANGAPVRLHESHRLEGNGTGLTILPEGNGKPLRFAYRVPGSSRALRIIAWDPDTGLGAESAYAVDTASPGMAWIDPAAEEPQLVLIEPRTGRLRIEQLSPADFDSEPDWPLEFYSTGATAEGVSAYTAGDFDGDGLPEIMIADAANSQVWRL